MNIYTPYTYLIKWSSTGMKYYGVRYAKNCHPDEFWKTYFTSSHYVKEYIIQYGEPDIIKIRKTFTDRESAISWESEVLKRLDVIKRADYLNKSNGQLIVNWNDIELKKKHHEGLLRYSRSNKGREQNSKAQRIAQNRPEQKQKLSEISARRWEDCDFRNKMSDIHKEKWKNNEFRNKMTRSQREASNRPEVKLANSIRNSGSNNARYDHTIYTFIHDNGTIERCTRYELRTKYSLGNNSHLGDLVHGRKQRAYSWRILKDHTDKS